MYIGPPLGQLPKLTVSDCMNNNVMLISVIVVWVAGDLKIGRKFSTFPCHAGTCREGGCWQSVFPWLVLEWDLKSESALQTLLWTVSWLVYAYDWMFRDKQDGKYGGSWTIGRSEPGSQQFVVLSFCSMNNKCEQVEQSQSVPLALSMNLCWYCRCGGPAFHSIALVLTLSLTQVSVWL